MTRPLVVITAVHNAFRADMAAIDEAALGAARGQPGLDATVERFWRMNEVLTWHAHGEEAGIFPALEVVAPDVVTAYEMDHRGLDAAFESLRSAVSAHDALETARATAAFKFHLDLHLAKEDQHLYVLFEERLSEAQQVHAVTALASAVTEQAAFIDWLFPKLADPDREHVLAYWQSVLPPEAFAGSLQLAKRAVGESLDRVTARLPNAPLG
jgi:hypothetical protein